MFTKILRRLVIKIENGRTGHCSDSTNTGPGHCS